MSVCVFLCVCGRELVELILKDSAKIWVNLLHLLCLRVQVSELLALLLSVRLIKPTYS